MISKAEIIAQYKEISQNYNSKYIDDYETFVRSRIIEYFFNLTHFSIDELSLLINTTLDDEGSDTLTVPQKKNRAMNGETITMPQIVRNISTVHGGTGARRLLPVWGSVTVVMVLAIFLYYRRK